MAKVHGKGTVIKVGASIVKGANTSSLPRTADVHETTEYGVDDAGNQGGLKRGTFTMGGVYDDTETTGPDDLLKGHEGETLAITYQIEGTGSGKPQAVFDAVLNSYVTTSPVNNMVTWQADFTRDGAIDDTPQS